MKRLGKLKPLHIYLIGSAVGLLSGLLIRPISETAHTVMVLVALAICIFGIVRYFRS